MSHYPLRMKNGEIHVWQADADQVTAHRELMQTLGREELVMAERFRTGRDRNRYIAAHGILRAILAGYVEAAPAEIVFQYGPKGKPAIAEGGLRFNMAHADGLILCAVSRTCDIGVDVERMRAGADEEVVRSFSLEAARALERLPPPARRLAFYKSWTRMEAYAKASGEGLTSGLEDFVSFLQLHDSVLLPHGGKQSRRWWFHDLCPRSGYAAALAAPQQLQVEMLELQPGEHEAPSGLPMGER